ncbi:hypothetical protein H696_05461 [Fonticula alba]|uniref:Uncharacterized protein n=1 Tax=Fonticula alba TaxID=691883 RepID=A0A058Z166_FONAL|nr:hypothetical protein H696_05461 [Fonticula alba]KCV67994.1 hypothetical protein H696_05461 [Fonticula alba]|eukprot:XP_009497561.1 hypothetical protein H696_05461 [Fonticula alba]
MADISKMTSEPVAAASMASNQVDYADDFDEVEDPSHLIEWSDGETGGPDDEDHGAEAGGPDDMHAGLTSPERTPDRYLPLFAAKYFPVPFCQMASFAAAGTAGVTSEADFMKYQAWAREFATGGPAGDQAPGAAGQLDVVAFIQQYVAASPRVTLSVEIPLPAEGGPKPGCHFCHGCIPAGTDIMQDIRPGHTRFPITVIIPLELEPAYRAAEAEVADMFATFSAPRHQVVSASGRTLFDKIVLPCFNDMAVGLVLERALASPDLRRESAARKAAFFEAFCAGAPPATGAPKAGSR